MPAPAESSATPTAAAAAAARSTAQRRQLKCFVLVEVLEFIPFRDFNADARAARTTTKTTTNK